jgi:alkaline phosphatase D
MPLRRASLPRGSGMRLYRRLRFGDLAEFNALDTRQYRSDQPCGDGNKPPCPEVLNPQATMMGAEQERWLFNNLDNQKRWQTDFRVVAAVTKPDAPISARASFVVENGKPGTVSV